MLESPRHLIYALEIFWASFDRCANPESAVLWVTQAMPKFISQQLCYSPSVELWYRFIVLSFLYGVYATPSSLPTGSGSLHSTSPAITHLYILQRRL